MLACSCTSMNQRLTEPEAFSFKFCPVCRGSGDGNGLGLCPACGGKGQIAEHNPYALFANSPSISELLSSAIEATSADFGNVQLFDSTSRALRIVAQHGFKGEFLSYFSTVCAGNCACGAALKERTRIVVRDVGSDPIFRDSASKDIML